VDTQILDLSLHKVQSYQGFYLMKALAPTGSGVEVKHSVFVALALDPMGMSKNQQVGTHLGELPLYLGRQDVGDPDANAFSFQMQVLRVELADFGTVDVAVNRLKRGQRLEKLSHFQAADVAGMPDFLTVPQKLPPVRVKIPVGIREQPDFQEERSRRRSAT